MQCPKCEAENEEGRRFCAECGASLGIACPECSFANRPGDRFCGGCGRTLTATSSDKAARKGETAKPELRQLTVMFCDLVGSTALAEHLDPEELHQLLAQYQDTCAQVINRYEGYISRYVGDGLLVYFGYPQAHEDDPRRAVRTGLDIVEAIKGLDAKFKNPGVNLAVRIGITTGMVVAGDIGSGERVEEKGVVGETPNLAARLQALAEPNTVVIGASTNRLVEGLFECDDLGEQRLKGISKPVRAHRVCAESGVPSRFEASVSRGLTPLIGREEEIGLLLKRWEQAKEGEGQVVLLSGEAGIGKSRIVRGFQERLKDELRNRVLYYCSPYYQNSALYPAIDQLERALRFEKNDSEAQKLDKLEAVLNDLGLPVQTVVPVLTNVLSLPTGERYPRLNLGPQELKKKTLETYVSLIGAMASQNPVLMVVEDVHWIDPSTQELITLLVEQLTSTRFLLLLTSRPEFVPPWSGHTHLTSFTLNRLSRKESVAMVAEVTEGKILPNDVLEQVVAKTDGVPLFVEELTKNVLESGLLEDTGDHYKLSGPLPSLAIPASLQDSLMARLDRLAPVKEVAQLAATLGRTFSHELLTAVSPLKETELDHALAELLNAELIYRRGLPPNARYEFKHALVQHAAYQSLLKSTRQQYHLQIAEVLEQRFPDTGRTQPELLAHHYTEAGVAKQAIGYWQKAGERASQRSANVEAIAHLTKGLELVKNLPETRERTRQELELYLALGPALMATKSYGAPEVEQTYLRARELCQEVGEATQLFTVTWGLWLLYQQRSQLKTARGFADAVLVLARRQADPALHLQAHHAAWTTLFSMPDLLSCRDHTEQGIALYNLEEHGGHAFIYGGHDPGVCALVHGAMALWFLGYADRALERMQDAVALAEELSHPYSLVVAFSYSAFLHHYRDEADLVHKRTEAAIAVCTEHGVAPQYVAAGNVLQGWALVAEGRAEEGITSMQQGLTALRATRVGMRGSYYLILLAQAYAQIGQADQGLKALSEALELVDKTGERTWEAEIYGLKGELLLASSANSQSESKACFNRAIEIARRQSAKSIELRAATSLSRLWRDQGKLKEAHNLLAPICDWFTEGFDTPDLKDAKALLDELA